MNPVWAQVGIAITGVIAIALSQSRHENTQRWACVFGVAASPFWFWSSIAAEQWGIFMMNFLYLVAWGKGVWVYWVEGWWRESMVAAANRAYDRDKLP